MTSGVSRHCPRTMQFGARRLRRFIVRRLEDQGTTQGFLRSPSRSGLKAAIPEAVSECTQ